MYSDYLLGRLAGGCSAAVLTSILVADREAANAARQESEWVVLVLRVEVVARAGGSRAVAGRLESSLSTAVEGPSRVGARGWAAKVRVDRGVGVGTTS